jgi:FkbM family methyltransferase
MIQLTKAGVNFKVTPSTPELNKFLQNIYQEMWENETFNQIVPYLDKNKTFIDIGAWQGPISLVAQQYSKQCLCFEPDTLAYTYLKHNVQLNEFTNIVCENVAVSAEPKLNIGAAVLGEGVTSFTKLDNSIECKTISIQKIFEKYKLTADDVSVIKIDIEGYECELLKDPFWKTLNVNMHISLHGLFFEDKQKYFTDLQEYFGVDYPFHTHADTQEIFIGKK